jgi:hypothetical protein
MSEADFIAYERNAHGSFNSQSYQDQLDYVLEKRDGGLSRHKLNLNSSVVDILSSMVEALQATGAAKIPPPPPLPTATSSSSNHAPNTNTFEWARAANGSPSKDHSSIDHRYDVNSNRGRDLDAFLSSIDPSYIEERRACRMDASAAALVARRLFSFQSIDGISLGWSSEAFAILVKSLIQLHEEYQSQLYVQSFYPLRLKFSGDEFRRQALDVYGGNLYLNPADTQLEWLESFQEVTNDRLQELIENRHLTEERVTFLQEKMGIKVKKGFSCSSLEYYAFLDNVVDTYWTSPVSSSTETFVKGTLLTSSKGLVPLESRMKVGGDPISLVVESPNACRRPKVMKEGFIQIPSDMLRTDLERALSRLSDSALELSREHKVQQEQFREVKQEVQWQLGVQKVYRTGVVAYDDFLHALIRLVNQSTHMGGRLAGYSLGIAGRGQFCSVADDGSLVVPHNWK